MKAANNSASVLLGARSLAFPVAFAAGDIEAAELYSRPADPAFGVQAAANREYWIPKIALYTPGWFAVLASRATGRTVDAVGIWGANVNLPKTQKHVKNGPSRWSKIASEH